MKFIKEYFFCNKKLIDGLEEVQEIEESIKVILWKEEFSVYIQNKRFLHQTAYHKAFDVEFKSYNWQLKPVLHESNPHLTGGYLKNDVLVSVQFGNSLAVFKDYYRFQYGLSQKFISLGVMILPVSAKAFFPTRPVSVINMAEFSFAVEHFKILQIPIPILIFGLLSEKKETSSLHQDKYLNLIELEDNTSDL